MSGLTGYDDRAHVGGRIRQARRELGLTQAELATRIGVSLGALDRFESGKADPSGKLERIAEVTERPVAWYTSVDAYDVGGGLYESGLPAELRKRLAASSGRRAPTDAELAEPGSAVGALTPQAPEGAPPEPVAPSEHSVRRAQPADELERVNANQQALTGLLEQSRAELATSRAEEVRLAQRVTQLETELRVAGERAAEATARLERAESELQRLQDEQRSAAEELDLRKAALTVWAVELGTREAAVTNAEAGVRDHGSAPPEVEPRPTADVEDEPPAQEGVHLAVAPGHGYRMVERAGAPPAPGEIVELDEVRYRCLRVQASPLPGDDRPLAVLELLPPEPPRSTE